MAQDYSTWNNPYQNGVNQNTQDPSDYSTWNNPFQPREVEQEDDGVGSLLTKSLPNAGLMLAGRAVGGLEQTVDNRLDDLKNGGEWEWSDALNPFAYVAGKAGRAIIDMLPEGTKDYYIQEGEKLSQSLEGIRKGIDQTAADNRPDYSDSPILSLADEAVTGVIPSLAIGVTTFAATKNPNAALAAMFPYAKSAAYTEGKDRGYTLEENNIRSNVLGGLEVVLSKLPLDNIIKGGKNYVAKVLKGSAFEGAEEGIVSVATDLYDSQVQGENISLEQSLDRMLHSVAVGALGGGAVTAVTSPFVQEQDSQTTSDTSTPSDTDASTPEPTVEVPQPTPTVTGDERIDRALDELNKAAVLDTTSDTVLPERQAIPRDGLDLDSQRSVNQILDTPAALRRAPDQPVNASTLGNQLLNGDRQDVLFQLENMTPTDPVQDLLNDAQAPSNMVAQQRAAMRPRLATNLNTLAENSRGSNFDRLEAQAPQAPTPDQLFEQTEQAKAEQEEAMWQQQQQEEQATAQWAEQQQAEEQEVMAELDPVAPVNDSTPMEAKDDVELVNDFKRQVAANLRSDNRDSAMAALDTINTRAREAKEALESSQPIDTSMRSTLVDAGIVTGRTFTTDNEAKLYAKSNQLGPVRVVKIGKGQWEVRQQLDRSSQVDSLVANGPQLPLQEELLRDEANNDSTTQNDPEFEGLDPNEIPDTPDYETVVADPEGQTAYATKSLRWLSRFGSVVASKLTKGYVEKGHVRFVGQKVGSRRDLALIGQVARNPTYETYRTVYVKDGVVVGESLHTSKLTGTTALFGNARDSKQFLADTQKAMDEYEADGYYLMHNHPTGKSVASDADVDFSKLVSDKVKGYQGHLIINNKTYGFIDENLNATIETLDVDTAYDLNDASIPSVYLGAPLTKVSDARDIAQRLKDDNQVMHLVGRVTEPLKEGQETPDSYVSGVMAISVEDFKNLSDKKKGVLVNKFMLGTSSQSVALVNVPELDTQGTQFSTAIQSGLFVDILDRKGRSFRVTTGIEKTENAESGVFERSAKNITDSPNWFADRSKNPAPVAPAETVEDEFNFTSPSETRAEGWLSPEPTPQVQQGMSKLGLAPKETQGILDKVKSWLKPDFKALGETITDGAFDGLAPIKRAELATKGTMEAYKSAVLSTGVGDVMQATLIHGGAEYRDGIIQQREGVKPLLGILEMLGGEQNVNDWLAWMGANRARELSQQTNKEGFSKEQNLNEQDIQALLDRANGRDEVFEQVRHEYLKLARSFLDLSEQAGIIDPKSRQEWDSEYYVPFFRESEESLVKQLLEPLPKRGIANQSAQIKQLQGSNLPTKDLLQNILSRWQSLTDAAMKNKAMLEAVDALQDSDYIERVDKLPQGRAFNAIRGQDEYVSVMRDGQREWYKVNDKPLLQAFLQLGGQSLEFKGLNAMRWARKVLTTGITASPSFMIRNTIRDSLSSWTINKSGEFKPVVDSIRGIKEALSNDKAYAQLMFAGASFQGGYLHGTDPQGAADMIRRALDAKGYTRSQQESYLKSLVTFGAVGDTLKTGWEKYRKVGDALENANRIATFEAELKSGKNMKDAAFEAKDLMNFSMRGNSKIMNFLADTVPFFNARIQGMYKLGREVKGRKGEERVAMVSKMLAQKGLMLAGVSIALQALNEDDERYKELPDWDKDANWHIFVGDEHFRIPKPFEMGIMFGSIPEKLYSAGFGNSEAGDVKDLITRSIGSTMYFNPVPQILWPAVEVAINRNVFQGRDIDSMADERRRPQDRYNEYTSETAKMIGKQLGFSPKKIEHLIKGYTGTLGTYILAASDAMARQITNAPNLPSQKYTNIPVAGEILRDVFGTLYQGDGPTKNTQHINNFYDVFNEAEQVYASLKHYTEQGNYEEVREIMEDNRELLAKRGLLKSVEKELKEFRDAIRQITTANNLDPEIRRERIDQLLKVRNQMMRNVQEQVGKG